MEWKSKYVNKVAYNARQVLILDVSSLLRNNFLRKVTRKPNRSVFVKNEIPDK